MTIPDKLLKLKLRGASLGEKTDALNGTFIEIENGLQGVGVTFWWTAGPRFDERTFEIVNGEERLYASLGYARIGTDWHLAVQDRREQKLFLAGWTQIGAEDPVALIRASRSIRIAVAPQIEGFLDAFDAAVAEMEARVEGAARAIGSRQHEALVVVSDAVDHANEVSMDRLRRALESPTERVELRRHVGHASAMSSVAEETAQAAMRLNKAGSRVARVLDGRGRRYECGVSAGQVAELLKGGAIEK